ncbi:hypothetical protein [Neotabrizicola sp. sgz301269]|uniref:hypothetical protein n=1 Tax=Neotabrizicola sp. sgz301269 TaxID=3276282 RepID=UPI00376FFAF1
MPYNSETGQFERVWQFVDQFEEANEIKRSDLDTSLDDLAEGINAALSSGFNYVGDWIAAGAFPTTRPDLGKIRARDTWRVSTAGTVGGVSFIVDDYLIALVDNPRAAYAGNWGKIPAGYMPAIVDYVAQVEADADRAEAAADSINWRNVVSAAALSALSFTQYGAGYAHDLAPVPYVWQDENYSARIAAGDPRYVAPTIDTSGASGAWVRAWSAVNTWAPPKWPSVDGSLYAGPIAHVVHRTGGWGTYGLALLQLSVDDVLPSGELDSVISAWGSAANQTGGTIFGGWIGANSPNSSIVGHVWTAGPAVGFEVNAGNRWGELGFQSDYGAQPRWTVGIQIVPDVLPADGMAPPASIYHGTFGAAVHQSIWGHKWHTGWITSVDSIVAGGMGFHMRGGSVLGNAPGHGLYMDGYHTNGIVIAGTLTDAFAITGAATRGINLSAGAFTTAFRLAAGQGFSWGTGGAQLSTTGGSLALSTGNADDDFAVYANNFATRVISADATGGVARTAVNGNTPVAKASLPANATDLATAIALANAISTALKNFGSGA